MTGILPETQLAGAIVPKGPDVSRAVLQKMSLNCSVLGICSDALMLSNACVVQNGEKKSLPFKYIDFPEK